MDILRGQAPFWMLTFTLLLAGCAAEGDVPDAQCRNGDTRDFACGTLDNGRIAQTCEAYQWVDSGVCDDSTICFNGDNRSARCGFNNRGEEEQICEAGAWVTTAPCNDRDTCSDGTTEDVDCANDVGLNGAKIRMRTCEHGGWSTFGSCVEPDVCKNGAKGTTFTVCGTDGQGTQSTICKDGEWVDDTCLQRASVLLAGRNSFFIRGVGNSPLTYAWGSDQDNALALHGGEASSETAVYPSLSRAKLERFSASATHQCGILEGTLYCWGNNSHGQLGLSPSQISSLPNPTTINGLSNNIKDVAVGDGFTCAVAAEEVLCWGRNDEHQLGNGNTTSTHTPEVIGLGSIVAAGHAHACSAITTSKDEAEVSCWGRNDSHQASEDSEAVTPTPRKHKTLSSPPGDLSGNGTFGGIRLELRLGDNHTIATWVSQVGQFYAYGVGNNERGQLGLGEIPFVSVAALIRHIHDSEVWKLETMADTTCVLTDAPSTADSSRSQQINCTGANSQGAIAPKDVPYLTAFQPLDFEDVVNPDSKSWRGFLALSAESLCLRYTFDGNSLRNFRIVCRGGNQHGELGDGTYDSRDIAEHVHHEAP